MRYDKENKNTENNENEKWRRRRENNKKDTMRNTMTDYGRQIQDNEG